MRFSIRDLIFATAFIAVLLLWWRDHRYMTSKTTDAEARVARLERSLRSAKRYVQLLETTLDSAGWQGSIPYPIIDWGE
jgi:hypothetical protein